MSSPTFTHPLLVYVVYMCVCAFWMFTFRCTHVYISTVEFACGDKPTTQGKMAAYGSVVSQSRLQYGYLYYTCFILCHLSMKHVENMFKFYKSVKI